MNSSPIVYLEIPSPKHEDSKEFYSKVFGWEIEDSDLEDTPYAMFKTGTADYGLTGGGLNPNLNVLNENSLSIFIGVNDIPSALERIKTHNGQIIKEKTEIRGGHGYFASFIDPSENHLNLWSRN